MHGVIVLHLHQVSRNCERELVSFLPSNRFLLVLKSRVFRPSSSPFIERSRVVWNNKADSTGRFADPIWRDRDNDPGLCHASTPTALFLQGKNGRRDPFPALRAAQIHAGLRCINGEDCVVCFNRDLIVMGQQSQIAHFKRYPYFKFSKSIFENYCLDTFYLIDINRFVKALNTSERFGINFLFFRISEIFNLIWDTGGGGMTDMSLSPWSLLF